MNDDIFNLDGKAAIVTGAAMGIGFAVAETLLGAGANVLLTDRDRAALDDAVGRVTAHGGKAEALAADVSDMAAGEAMTAACVEAFGSVDVLVNNAGIFPMSPVLDMTPEFFDRVLGVNLRGLVFASRAAARQMVEQGGGGAIVNVASIDALRPSMVGLAAYDASKGGVLMFTRNLALELAPHGIRVNAVAPGGIATEGASKPLEGSGMTKEQQEAMQAEFAKSRVPLGRMGRPAEIAAVVLFLASPAASYVTGELVVADGGALLL